ncbi:type II toxin-antitoxin system HicA family toxin [Candidatus Uhrbacteria bacterium]|nr:type II toxin-antitoxin system HicA family toxin [Candidatus Uhrbacteria bacterium]
MGKLKALSGREVISILNIFGFTVVSQRGSHVKLFRMVREGERQTLTIPLHQELDRGTIYAIFRQATRYIQEESLRSHFYNN